MGRARSSHIWLNSAALTSHAWSWPWELASGCGKGIVFPNIAAFRYLCVIAYTCLCMITLTTQQGRHLWRFGCQQGRLQLMLFGGRKVLSAATQSLPRYVVRIWQCWISAATACLACRADGVRTKTAPPKLVESVNHLVYLDYHESAGTVYGIKGILLKIACAKITVGFCMTQLPHFCKNKCFFWYVIKEIICAFLLLNKKFIRNILCLDAGNKQFLFTGGNMILSEA